MNNVIDLDDYSVCDACGYDRRDYEESGEYVDQVGDIVENHIGVAVLTPTWLVAAYRRTSTKPERWPVKHDK